MDQNTLNRILIDRAVAIADARVQRNMDRDSRLKTPKYADSKFVNPRTYFGEALAFLKDKYGKASDAELGDLIDTKDADLVKWIWERGPSPTDIKGTLEAREFLKLLNGVAPQGKDWYSMGTDALKGKAVDMGWKVNTPERFNEFLKKVGEYQQQYDRAKLAEELRNMPGYTLSSIAFPTAVKEIENAVATGEGGDLSTVSNMAAMDALVNGGMLMAPNIAVSKTVPLFNAGLGAGTQAILEAARQAYAENTSKNGQEFDSAMPVLAGSLGATTPGIVGLVRGTAAQIPGEAAARFNRGAAKAIKTTDPELAERNQLVRNIQAYNNSTINRYNKEYTEDELGRMYAKLLEENPSTTMISTSESKPILFTALEPGAYETEKNIAALPNNLKLLFGDKAINKGGIDAEYVLGQYGKPLRVFSQVNNGEIAAVGPTNKEALKKQMAKQFEGSKIWGMDPEGSAKQFVDAVYPETRGASDAVVLDEKTLPVFKQMFPAKVQSAVDEYRVPGASKWAPDTYRAGRWISGKLQDLGSSVEPTFKVVDPRNPLKTPDYKETTWYKKLDDEKKKLVDDAFDKAKKKRGGN